VICGACLICAADSSRVYFFFCYVTLISFLVCEFPARQRRCHEFQQSYGRGEPAEREQVFLGGKNDRVSAAGWLHLGEKSTARTMESLR
jgi:hypothetical protein